MKRKHFIRILGSSALGMMAAPRLFASQNAKTNHVICEQVWNTLCGDIGSVYDTDAFTYVRPEPGKPNVLIYGDSVSIGYTSEVRAQLADQATVIRLFKNGGSSKQFISNMDKMHEAMFQPYLDEGWAFQWDVIHFNFGLHDLKYLKGKHLNKAGTQVSSIASYKANLKSVCDYLQDKFPKAQLIFATTTPVPEGAKGRFNGDAAKFNLAAKAVLKDYPKIAVNDLYEITLPNQNEWAQEPGNVHFNAIGKTEQGKSVASFISKFL